MAPPSSTGRKRTSSTPKKSFSKVPLAKKSTRPNASILNFFQKAEKPEQTLFLDGQEKHVLQNEDDDEPNIYDTEPWEEEERFNEVEASIKKRRLSPEDEYKDGEPSGPDESKSPVAPEPKPASPTEAKPAEKQSRRRKGPFLEESESEEEDDTKEPAMNPPFVSAARSIAPVMSLGRKEDSSMKREEEDETPPAKETNCPPLSFKVEDSIEQEFANVDEFGDLDDFPDDEDFGGEEYRMMRFMEEQARLEAEAEAADTGDYSCDEINEPVRQDDAMVANCPICDGSLAGITPDEATRHVNACLDGNPISLPQPTSSKKPGEVKATATVGPPEINKRFARAAVPRAGQANPFQIGETESKPISAFTKLMSGHAEDAAWAGAAAAEHSARGKPAYQRTCPFYKIMPGFYICVDAFRYGAVKGCKAYFLSHFHSDHYIGLTANWTHGPIYCSKVTGDLVKMQLRVAAKWVVPLDFDKTQEVPSTEGVTVTMIPANHCPGSSLFFFEKTIGKGQYARKQRILHCGDFRACPAQVAHPLLKPEVQDSISGKTRQQKIDVCYLDTTYLNPRYSFPPQNDVINACAELCKSLASEQSSENNAWDKINREAGTDAVSKFFTKTNGDVATTKVKPKNILKERLLVICGTYSIGKERICKAIAQALGSKIFASKSKIRICSKLGDPELTALMTDNPLEAQVHMQMLMEIRAETLQDYLNSYKPHFSRVVGFRPSGWNYRPQGAGKSVSANTQPGTIPTTQILQGKAWRSRFGAKDFVAQRGSTKEAMCFGVPYSEHSSFRELAMFLMALHIEKVVPTVNIGSETSRKRMKGWTDKWLSERRKSGLLHPLEGDKNEANKEALWDGKNSHGGGVWW